MAAKKNKNPAPLDILKIIIYNRHAKTKGYDEESSDGKMAQRVGFGASRCRLPTVKITSEPQARKVTSRVRRMSCVKGRILFDM